jgi:hypothetical protein
MVSLFYRTEKLIRRLADDDTALPQECGTGEYPDIHRGRVRCHIYSTLRFIPRRFLFLGTYPDLRRNSASLRLPYLSAGRQVY